MKEAGKCSVTEGVTLDRVLGDTQLQDCMQGTQNTQHTKVDKMPVADQMAACEA